MQELENYFKNREEVEKYFSKEMFEFQFMSDGVMYFRTLEPVFIGDNLGSFQLSFYSNHLKDFFKFSSFKSWLSEFQLAGVTWISEETEEQTGMYFERYKETE